MSDFSINFVQFTTKEENKRTEKSPDVTGNIEVPADQVNALISYLQNAERVLDWQDKEVVKISLAGWNNEIKQGENKGNYFLSGKLSSPWVPQDKPAAKVEQQQSTAIPGIPPEEVKLLTNEVDELITKIKALNDGKKQDITTAFCFAFKHSEVKLTRARISKRKHQTWIQDWLKAHA